MEHKILKITVNLKNSTLYWQVQQAVEGGNRIVSEPPTFQKFTLDPTVQSTINFLVELLHFFIKTNTDQLDSDLLRKFPRILGENLFKVLFYEKVGVCLKELLNDLRDENLNILRIELEFEDEDSELASWPWEFLYTEDAGLTYSRRFLVTNAKVVINRYLQLRGGKIRAIETPQPKVLVVVSRPGFTPRRGDTDIDPNYQGPIQVSILDSISKLAEGNEPPIKLKILEQQPIYRGQPNQITVTRKKFKAVLKEFQPNIIHFIGHGRRNRGKGQIAFIRENGTVDWVPDVDFSSMVDGQPELKMVFLQACESARPDPKINLSDLARQLANLNITAVIAMQARIENEVANAFAKDFYECLKDGQPVDLAVRAGRDAIQEMHNNYRSDENDEEAELFEDIAFGLPVLYLRDYGSMFIHKKPVQDSGTASKGRMVAPPPGPGLAIPNTCPRCGAIAKKEAVCCYKCQLLFKCPHVDCGEFFDVWDDQVDFCPNCAKPVNQPPDATAPQAAPAIPDEFRVDRTPKEVMNVAGLPHPEQPEVKQQDLYKSTDTQRN